MKFLIYIFLQGLSFVRWYNHASLAHCLVAVFFLGVARGPDRLAAQTKSDLGWSSLKMGLQASLQPSWIASDNRQIQPGHAGLGWSIGMNAAHSFAPRYAFLTGVLLRGNVFNVRVDSFRYKIPGMDTVLRDFSYQYRIQGLEIPLMLRLGGAQSSTQSAPFALFGLTTMWNTRVRACFEGQELIGYETGDFFDPSNETYRVTNVPGSPVDQDDRVALFSAWLGIGLGWEFPLASPMRLSTGFRYDYPLTQVFRGDYFKGRLHSIQISAYLTL
ncbi:MAG: PorT family protein [Sphingomonadales bacterium]|nr:PorT family protein [Sphingomonadales bacterium]MBM3923960.1 PorT family protein [Sphingomonadales bacterium]